MDQRIIDLYDQFTHGGMNRRTFLDRLAALAGSAAAAAALLPVLQNDYAMADTVDEKDPRIAAETLDIPGVQGLRGYLVRPKSGGDRLPTVLVIHENRGLNPHIKDVTRRLATEGFIALGLDYLSPMGGTPADEDKGREMIGQLKQPDVIASGKAAVAYLKGLPGGNGKVGAVGFCWGGGAVNNLAVADPDLAAGVAYYGAQPKAEDVPKIGAALLLHYAGLDERINAGIPAYEDALRKAGKTYELYVYEDANHAFNNDTNAARYDKKAADLAWSRTVAFLKKHLA
ncbi:dienelactone hydrolase family protein [Microvirga thermotolerans]|uniref:Dienelactone hydrolase family protein n=1 Tax=Microvirga thermotolerans TaxID=2651334 RepID=A0A5P9JYZ8_9HYPH|nr:dienelactone hydrolase family protein [Microvirga thermotolerans]QFU16640.1 dienelactone hydrolase family protein [Microvirga thermotolerans]